MPPLQPRRAREGPLPASWYLEADAHREVLALEPRRAARLRHLARALAGARWPSPAGHRALARLEDTPGLRALARPMVRRMAATEALGEVATPPDAAEALMRSTAVARVEWPARGAVVLALGALAGLVREEGGRAEHVSPASALVELRAALKSGLTVVVVSVGPPYVAAVTAHAPVLPMGLCVHRALWMPVRPGPRRPAIDATLCNACGECVKACPTNRLVVRGGRVAVKSKCSGCGRCAAFCPQSAISMVVPAPRAEVPRRPRGPGRPHGRRDE